MALDRGMQAIVASAVLSRLSFIFISIRCVSRFIVIKQAGVDDYLIIFALIPSIGLTASIALCK